MDLAWGSESAVASSSAALSTVMPFCTIVSHMDCTGGHTSKPNASEAAVHPWKRPTTYLEPGHGVQVSSHV